MDIALLIGIAGATIILVFFLLNQFHKINRDSLVYDLANTIGAGLLLYYAFLIGSVPFMILNLIWGGFSLRDAINSLLGSSKNR